MKSMNLRSKLRMPLLGAVLFVVALSGGFAGCSPKADQNASSSSASSGSATNNTSSAPTDSNAPKRYKMTGKIVSVDKAQKSAQIAGDDIPGFMGAMTMSYPVINGSELDKVNAGDTIAADVVVTPDGYHVENIVVTKKASGAAAASPSSEEQHIPAPGDQVPDFALTNQDGKQIHLSSFHGDVLLVTFIYTKCPFPNFCPLLSHNFANIYADAKKDPALGAKIKLLTISFDTKNDSPAVLRKYGETFRSITHDSPFDKWEFATASAEEMKKMSDFFGISYEQQNGVLVHSMSTSVITPDGKIYKWYDDAEWKANDLMKDASEALLQNNSSNATAQARLGSSNSSAAAQAN
jgi:protein SCO1/2